MQTAVSVIPFAIFASVLPVQGLMMSASRGSAGPSGSAPTMVCTISLPVRVRTRSRRSAAVPKRVSVDQTVSLTIGWISYPAFISSPISRTAFAWVQKEPQMA